MTDWMSRSRLLGRIITLAKISENQDTMTFKTDVGDVEWYVEGDCCSSSVLTDLKLGPVMLKKIVRVEDVEAPTDEVLNPSTLSQQQSLQEYESIYGVRLVAEDGSQGYVIYRNYSNGYYGGWINETNTERWL